MRNVTFERKAAALFALVVVFNMGGCIDTFSEAEQDHLVCLQSTKGCDAESEDGSIDGSSVDADDAYEDSNDTHLDATPDSSVLDGGEDGFVDVEDSQDDAGSDSGDTHQDADDVTDDAVDSPDTFTTVVDNCKGVNCDDGNVCTNDSCNSVDGSCTNTHNSADCDDENVCTLNDFCEGGFCISGIDKKCPDEGNPCTDESCDQKKGCVSLPNSATCTDGNACTTADTCTNGKCTPQGAKDCNDGDKCTSDSCDIFSGCEHVSKSGECDCEFDVDCIDKNPCTTDSCKDKKCQYGFADNEDCTDDGPCTEPKGKCKSGKCVVKLKSCDDDNHCTNDSCDQKKGCVSLPNSVTCTDGNACTKGDICKDGSCQKGSPVACDDDNPCTSDSCDTSTGKCLFKKEKECLGHNKCTKHSDCLAKGSKFVGCWDVSTIQNSQSLGYCQKKYGDVGSKCLFELIGEKKPCSDGLACTLDLCNTGKGCVVELLQHDKCDDGNVCTNDSCDQKKGCVSLPNSAPCDDGDKCTENDKCADKKCVAGTPVTGCIACKEDKDCEDDDICTADFCFGDSGCKYKPSPPLTSCDDSNLCTVGDTCKDSKCTSGKKKVCNDSNPCTNDSCNKDKGCVYLPNSATCTDGSVCTLSDQCKDSKCSPGTTKDCNDSNPCTNDSCDKVKGCLHSSNTASCDDGDKCTENDKCADKKCVAGKATQCDDKDPCTADSCDSKTGKCKFQMTCKMMKASIELKTTNAWWEEFGKAGVMARISGTCSITLSSGKKQSLWSLGVDFAQAKAPLRCQNGVVCGGQVSPTIVLEADVLEKSHSLKCDKVQGYQYTTLSPSSFFSSMSGQAVMKAGTFGTKFTAKVGNCEEKVKSYTKVSDGNGNLAIAFTACKKP